MQYSYQLQVIHAIISVLILSFDGYKLKFDSSIKTKLISLNCPVSIEKKASMALDIPYKILEDRARFNHLFVSPFDDTLLYFINERYTIVSVDIDATVTAIFQGNESDVDIKAREFPSISFPCAEKMIFCDGMSMLYLLSCDAAGAWTKTAMYSLDYPFCMTGSLVNSDECTSVMGYRTEIDLSGEIRKSRFTTILFNLSQSTLKTHTLLATESTTGPLFSKISSSGDSFIVASEFPNELIKSRQKQSVPSAVVEEDAAPMFQYNWTQTEEDVTIYVNLSASVDTRFVNGRFTAKYVHLSLLHPVAHTLFNSEHLLFDDIEPLESIWTLEGNGRLITIYLAKKHAPFRWTQLFMHDGAVVESLDHAVLSAYNLSLDKFTGDESETQSHAHAMTEKAEAIDFEGQYVSFVRCAVIDGQDTITHRNACAGHEWLCKGFGNASQFCMGYDVDGLVYSLSEAFTFTHTSTFSAFNFIKNSKLEKQVICFTKDGNWVVIVEMKRYVFLYRKEGSGEGKSDQMMVDLFEIGGESESVVGVQQCMGNTIAVLRNSSIVLISLE